MIKQKRHENEKQAEQLKTRPHTEPGAERGIYMRIGKLFEDFQTEVEIRKSEKNSETNIQNGTGMIYTHRQTKQSEHKYGHGNIPAKKRRVKH